jgi:DNA topoisomerase-1
MKKKSQKTTRRTTASARNGAGAGAGRTRASAATRSATRSTSASNAATESGASAEREDAKGQLTVRRGTRRTRVAGTKKSAAPARTGNGARGRRGRDVEVLPPPPPGTTALVIVESPAKAKTISKYLGRGYRVKATVGHVRDLPQKKLGVDVEHGFKPEYVTIAGKEKTLAELRDAAKESREIYIATDPDREGEAIAWNVAGQLARRSACAVPRSHQGCRAARAGERG